MSKEGANLEDTPDKVEQAIAYFSEQVTITMSRSEWQAIALQLQLKATDRRVGQETRNWLRRMRNRIWTTIHG